MNTEPKNMSPEGAMRPRLFELSGSVPVSHLEMIAEDLKEELLEYLEGRLDHWTDDEGLHRLPFEKDYAEGLDELLSNALKGAL